MMLFGVHSGKTLISLYQVITVTSYRKNFLENYKKFHAKLSNHPNPRIKNMTFFLFLVIFNVVKNETTLETYIL